MSDQDAFERILAALHDAMLDDSHWPATSALIDEACGTVGNALMVRAGSQDDSPVSYVGLYYRGERREDWEREYLEIYHPSTKGSRVSGNCPTAVWCTPAICIPPKS